MKTEKKDAKKDVVKPNVADKDPHVWHDVKNTMYMVDKISDHLVKIDPTNAAYYQGQGL